MYLGKIVKAAQTMDVLLSDILKLSHVSLAPVSEENISVEDVIEESLRLLEADVQRTQAKITIAQPLPTIRANRTLLLQIFSNLLTNALKFARPGEVPHVQVFGRTAGAECVIHVKDNGIGIPQELHEAIFKPFDRGRADASTSGTGVGLAVVKKAVERLGGTVRVISTEGHGSEFILVLPCTSAGDLKR